MSKIITIGRELGSGGRTIGKLVAGKLDIPYYDRDLIDKAAEQTGLTTNYVESTEQKITNSFLYNLAMGSSYAYHILAAHDKTNRPLSEQVYIAQQQVINEYAQKGSCVIVGRCADSILSEHFDVFKVFIYADMEKRVERCISQYHMSPDSVDYEIRQSDKNRRNHYNNFTDKEWGNRHNYDLLLNSSTIGYEKCADIICELSNN